MRLYRFARFLWACRKFLSRHNVRALWLQSRKDWTPDGDAFDGLSDAEFDAFMESIR